MKQTKITVLIVFLTLAPFILSAYGGTLPYRVFTNDDPVESELDLGVDFGMGVIMGEPMNLYYNLDLKLAEKLRLTATHRFFNPLSLVMVSMESDEDYGDYFLNSYLKGGVEIPFFSVKTPGTHRGFTYYNRRRFDFSEEVLYSDGLSLRAGYTHSVGGPAFLTGVTYDQTAPTWQTNQIFFNKNWHGVYAGLSLTRRHGLLISVEPEGEEAYAQFMGRNVRHSLDAHYYFLTHMITTKPGTHIESSLPMAFEYNFTYSLYGSNRVPFLGAPANLRGPVNFNVTIGAGPFFSSPSGIEYEEELFPTYFSFAVGWPIGI